MKERVSIDDELCIAKISSLVSQKLSTITKSYDEICIACIGTDRSTGDALGPLVGTKLKDFEGVKVIGNLKDPLHAQRIEDFANTINENQLVIAVDASLGILENVGTISVSNGPLKPGSGLEKDLPPIGDINIMGVVNTGGFMDFFILQSTRLSFVMEMADIIANGLIKGLKIRKEEIAL